MYKILVSMSLLILLASCGGSDGDDLIVLQNGSRQIGTLQGCLNDRCQFNGGAIPQTSIVWIGLHQARSKPPRPIDPRVGEIRLMNQSVHPGQMTAVSATHVNALSGSYDRVKVAWIYLAAGNGMPTPSSELSDGCRHAIYHYDLHIAGFRRAEDTMNPDSWVTGKLSITYDWTAEWSNVSLGLTQCGGVSLMRTSLQISRRRQVHAAS